MKTNKVSSFYILTLVFCLSVVALVLFLVSYNPSEIGFIATLMPLFLVWLAVFSFLRLFSFLISRQNNTVLRFLSITVSSVTVLVLMFSALGDVSLLDVVLLFTLAALGNFYLARTWPK